MHARIGIVFASICFAMFSVDRASADKKPSPQKQIVKAYDKNHDGKLGRYERAAAMPAIAAMREQRAMRRNAKALQGIQ